MRVAANSERLQWDVHGVGSGDRQYGEETR